MAYSGISGTQTATEQEATCDAGTWVLHGTIQLPASKKAPYPVVLLISGSGPSDRNGNSPLLKGHNDALKMIADALAAHGIASLRYDKRGIAASRQTGMKESELRFDNYVDDAVLWGQYLRKDGRFSSLVIAGHSEGSLIGMLAAARLNASAYISLDGPGRPAGTVILEQLKTLPPDLLKQAEDIIKALNDAHQVESVPPALAPLFRPSIQPYIISWFKYDPGREISKLRMPVLILQGTTDIQVTEEDAKLLAAGDPSAKLAVIEGMNHVLKEVPADSAKQLASYSDPSLPVSPRLLDEMIGFVNGLNSGK
ncbi:MAG TPA: alpha/beta fold hydrolase [Blastocatellia bacterium]